MSKKETTNRGGARPGSGRKNKFNEPATTINILCPNSKVEELKKIIDKFLKPFYATNHK